MKLDMSQIDGVYLACGYTDMRMSIDGLANRSGKISYGPVSKNPLPFLRKKVRQDQGAYLG